MADYLRAVTLGAFTWKNKERVALFFEHIRKTGTAWLLAHFLLLTICVNFPVTLVISRLSPFELYGRVYGGNAVAEIAGNPVTDEAETEKTKIDNFNLRMIESGYGRNILLPLLGLSFVLSLIIQAAFYLFAVFFLGLSRMNTTPLSFHDRFGLAVFSSTLPALASALFGLVLPTVHIIVFFLIVIFFIFQRSNLYA